MRINFKNVESIVIDQMKKDPDFSSRYTKLQDQNVGLFAKKSFIFITENSVQIRELNCVERILRAVGFYSDSVFTPWQLTVIKNIFNRALEPSTPTPILPEPPSDLEETEEPVEPPVPVVIDPKKIDCVGVRLHKSLKKRVTKQLCKLQYELKKIEAQAPGHIKHGQVEAFQEKFGQFATSIKKPIAKAMRNSVAQALRNMGVTESDLAAYLDDPEKGVQRIYEQTQLFLPTNPYSKLWARLTRLLEESRESLLRIILSEYEPKECGGEGDCLFHCCARLAPEKDVQGWRRAIAAKIKHEEANYGELVASRLHGADRDNCVAGLSTYQEYADWIARQGKWGGGPEVQAFSDLVGRPVLVVQELIHGYITFRKGCNLALDKEPLVFFNIGEGHFQAGVSR